MMLSQILIDISRKRPRKLAVICGEERYDYKEFRYRVLTLASKLKELVGFNDRVAIIHKNCHYFLESYFATAYIGAVLVPINYRLTKMDYSYILNNSDAKVLISHTSFANEILSIIGETKVREIIWTDENFHKIHTCKASKVSDNCMAQIYYTSGTTGRPKGVVLTHGNNYLHALGAIKELELTERDRWLHVSPMFHLADAWAVWAITKVGGVHVIVPEFKPEKVLRSLESHKITLSNFIPTMLNILVNHPHVGNYDYHLRLIMSGGAPISPDVAKKVMDLFKCDYIQTYGMTETSPFLTMSILKPHLKKLPPEEQFRYKVTTGRPFATIKLKVVNEKGKEVRRDGKEVGEVIVKGETVTSQYWKLPEVTSQKIKDGWLYTGDLATVNKEGYITIVDRKDDMIITGGENVYSIEVENILYSHPDILEAAVIGIPDEIWGEKIVAIVALKPGRKTSKEEIINFCKQHLAHFKAPKDVKFMERLPKTGSGKIFKSKLKQLKFSGKED
jgi:acyl-CoA synthetase (AMP-forming)/AMP-acid ligase II